jgi:dimethylhistidine N-methyltransferase
MTTLLGTESLQFPNLAPSADQFRADVVHGLRTTPKAIPCKYFYDEAGSRLFDRITRLKEYYLTRAEFAIMRQHAQEMAALVGSQCLLIEYGSGSSLKTRLLLDHLRAPSAYMPVDISGEHLRRSVGALGERYPDITLVPVCADFTHPRDLPVNGGLPERRVVYFPGSTIGNFTPSAAIELLERTASLCRGGGGMLLGVDLKKEPAIIEAAYNDGEGVTAAFNRNLLVRINRELDADFPVTRFWHHAFYDPRNGRIEMHLVSQCDQRVKVGAEVFDFAEGESILTEYSYKYSVADLEKLSSRAGFRLKRRWLDENQYFCVLYLVPTVGRHGR